MDEAPGLIDTPGKPRCWSEHRVRPRWRVSSSQASGWADLADECCNASHRGTRKPSKLTAEHHLHSSV
eukprot:6433341-Prymnesium_polylepis.1